MRTSETGTTFKMADEEDEEEVCDSWEDMADSGELERRMEERNKLQMKKEEKSKKAEVQANGPVLVQEDTTRTQYKPQLRILKRPDSGKDSRAESAAQDKTDKPVIKSLAERQAQYAEARARILGSACDGSEDSDSATCISAPDEQFEGAAPPWTLQASVDKIKLPDNVIRQPFGPDGTIGFHSRR
ncbi:SUZ domain-containing protein 1-like [Actinia tenebrosa]|uniref:SUZ RNA-binding domain-containing n=1 Tax=Actinia tenebrosa TaxID=6105 RepID=A0A6P8I591_ACTTE|nr:SUZ domain-containing protein 1-like [Actinia tenebrosa]